jgi:hypothetical protein
MTVNRTMKFGPLGTLMEVLMARPQMKRTMVGILDGLDQFAGASAPPPAAVPA